MPDFPTAPGSVIRATSADGPIPSPYMLLTPNEPLAVPVWMHSNGEDIYRQSDLGLIEVLHDEGMR